MMHSLAQMVLCLAAVTTAGALVALVFELHRVRAAIENPRRRLHHCDEYAVGTSTHHTFSGPHGGFAVYVYRDGHWHLEADMSAPGCEAAPPAIKGSFEGQVVKKESTVRK